jgi:predicted nucleotide-binding protein
MAQLPVEQFLENLLRFDAAVVVLGADNVQKKANEDVHVPRHNVVVELGASLARLGIKRTFLANMECRVIVEPWNVFNQRV